MIYLVPLLTLIIGSAISIITLIVKAKADYYTLIATQEFSLRKEYFIKKLNAFEKATSYYSIAHMSITSMSMIMQTSIKVNVEFDPKVLENMLGSVQNNMIEVLKLTQDSALALPLYTDMELNDADEALAEQYTQLLGEINSHVNVVDFLKKEIDNSTKIINPRAQQIVSEIAEERKQIGEKIAQLYEISKELKEKNKELIAALRGQLKPIIEREIVYYQRPGLFKFWKK